jgi:hypothetical protein
VAASSGLAAALLLVGCAPAAPTGTAPTGTAPAVAAAVESAAAAQYASDLPPAAAQMVCSDELRRELGDALGLAEVPAPTPTWADHVYTCTYPLPTGRLVLSVSVAPSTAAARSQLEEQRGRLGSTDEEPALGQEAYSAAPGTVIAGKDNMVLTVDATGLPDGLGATSETRLDLARVVAAAVFSCWTGTS